MDNSLAIMEQLNKAVEDIESVKIKTKAIENEIEQKLNIIDVYNSYISEQLDILNKKEITADKEQETILFGYNADKNKIVGGQYSIFGSTINPPFVVLPDDVFNIYSNKGSIYKNNGIVKFYDRLEDGTLENEDYQIAYSDILKDKAVYNVGKTDVFKTFNTNTITMSVQVLPGLASINNSQFNMIEIEPYLPGSFDIEEIRIFTLDQYYKNDMIIADKVLSDVISDVDDMRIMLDDKCNMYKVEFDLKLKYQKNGYPFGLRNLHFYNVSVDKENSNVIVEIDKNNYIASVGQDITIATPDGAYNTTVDKYGVKYYMFYDNGVLQTPVSNPISRNITKFYAEIPLSNTLTAITFKQIKLRN